MKNLVKIFIIAIAIVCSCKKDKKNEITPSGTVFKLIFGGSPQYNFKTNNLTVTNDKSFVIVYHARDTISNSHDIFLRKIDSVGNLVWEHKYTNQYFANFGICVSQTSDNGFIIGGSKAYDYFWNTTKACIIKTDQNGNEVWSKTFNNGEEVRAIHELSNGNYMMIYEAFNGNVLAKLNSMGDTIWTKNTVGFHDMQITSDGGTICVGQAITRYDGGGGIVWTKNYGYSKYLFNELHSVKQFSDNSYITVGPHGDSDATDLCLIKLNQYGDIIYQKIYNYNLKDMGNGIEITSDGKLIAIATIEEPSGEKLIKVLKLDINGNIISSINKNYSTHKLNDGLTIKELSPNKFIISARTFTSDIYDNQIALELFKFE